MNSIIDDLIQKLEQSPNKVATKEYVLRRLIEAKRRGCDHCVGECSKVKEGA